MELYLNNSQTATESLFFFLTIGVTFFGLSTIAMLILFGWSIKDASKNINTFVVLLAISLAVPYGTYYVTQNLTTTQASPATNLHQVEVVPIDDQSVLMQFKTDAPAIIYLEVTNVKTQEMIPILPTNGVEKQTSHSFMVPRQASGTEVVFIVNGERFYIDNKPYLIKQ